MPGERGVHCAGTAAAAVPHTSWCCVPGFVPGHQLTAPARNSVQNRPCRRVPSNLQVADIPGSFTSRPKQAHGLDKSGVHVLPQNPVHLLLSSPFSCAWSVFGGGGMTVHGRQSTTCGQYLPLGTLLSGCCMPQDRGGCILVGRFEHGACAFAKGALARDSLAPCHWVAVSNNPPACRTAAVQHSEPPLSHNRVAKLLLAEQTALRPWHLPSSEARRPTAALDGCPARVERPRAPVLEHAELRGFRVLAN